MSRKLSITREQVVELLDYSPDTGIFKWRDPGYAPKAKGGIAGYYDKDGYRKIRVLGVGIMAHHIAWFITYGRWPTHMLDHINCVKDDNRIANLREATNAQNQMNRKVMPRTYAGLKGVCVVHKRNGPRFRAVISINGTNKILGHFATPELAHEAYRKAAIEHHGEFARLE